MGITIQESTSEAFFQRLHSLENTLKSRNTLIDDSLCAVKKSGFKWTLLCLLRPFFALFCCDTYLHYRVDRVVQSLLKYCAANHRHVQADSDRSLSIFRKIVVTLEQKTSGKYVEATREAIVNFVNNEWGYCHKKPSHEKPCHVVLPLHAGSKLLWPTDLESFGLTKEDALNYDQQINALLAKQRRLGAELKFSSGRIELWKGKELLQSDNFPFAIIQNPSNGNLIITTNSLLKEGGERKVYLGFDLMSGELLVEKPVVGSSFEKAMLKHLHEERARRGIFLTCFTHTKGDKKDYVVETLCQGTFPSLFGTRTTTLKARIALMLDLLQDLEALHKQRFRSSLPKTLSGALPTYGAFHLDIKPANILVTNEGRLLFCDIGKASGNLGGLVSSPGYTPVEYVDFHKKRFPTGFLPTEEDATCIQQFNEDMAQRRDMWAIGLIMLILLTADDPEKGSLVPLNCIKTKLTGSVYKEEGLTALTQHELEQELAFIRNKLIEADPVHKTIYENLINNIIKWLLIIDTPVQRYDAAKTLKLVQSCLQDLTRVEAA